MYTSLKPYLEQGVVPIIDEGGVFEPANPVGNGLHKETCYLQNTQHMSEVVLKYRIHSACQNSHSTAVRMSTTAAATQLLTYEAHYAD